MTTWHVHVLSKPNYIRHVRRFWPALVVLKLLGQQTVPRLVIVATCRARGTSVSKFARVVTRVGMTHSAYATMSGSVIPGSGFNRAPHRTRVLDNIVPPDPKVLLDQKCMNTVRRFDR